MTFIGISITHESSYRHDDGDDHVDDDDDNNHNVTPLRVLVFLEINAPKVQGSTMMKLTVIFFVVIGKARMFNYLLFLVFLHYTPTPHIIPYIINLSMLLNLSSFEPIFTRTHFKDYVLKSDVIEGLHYLFTRWSAHQCTFPRARI